MQVLIESFGTDAAWVALLVNTTLKGSLVLVITGLIAALFRKRSAATRHFIWALGIVCLLMLPLLSNLLPTWNVGLLPAQEYASPVIAVPQELNEAPQSVPSTAPVLTEQPAPHSDAVSATGSSELEAVPVPTTPASSSPSLPLSTWLLLTWGTGVGVVLLRRLIGTVCVWWMSRRAEPLIDPEWSLLVQQLSRRLDLSRPVLLRQSNWDTMPMTWGLVYPTVLLPADADEWDTERKSIVLIHELAHIKRWDHLTQFATQLVCALHWFNPLVWYATREMNKERERACDDFVLTAGTQPTEYAGHILDIARTFHAGRLSALATVSMARRSQLEGRLMAILDPHLSRRSMSRLATTVSWMAGLLLVFPLAAMHPWSDSVAEPTTIMMQESGSIEVAASRPDTVVRHPQPGDALDARWTWAQDQTRALGAERGAWVGYSIHRLMRENEFIQRNGHLSFSGRFNTGIPIKELITGSEQPRSFRVSRETADLVSKEVAVLFKLTPEGHITEEVALNDVALGMDFGNRPFIWLGEADNQQSIELLKTVYRDAGSERLKERVISALGVHQEPDLIAPFLIETLQSNEENDIREKAAYWLGQQDTPEALDILTQTVRSDRSTDVREEAVSSIALMAVEASTDALIDIARTDRNPEVQKQATYWLGQKEPEKTKAVLEDIAYARMSVSADTSKKDLELMKQALHALAELDDGAGIPELVRIARTHSVPEIRAEAVYWLGESDSDAVLSVLEEFVFQNEDVEVQKRAVYALSELSDDRGMPTLIRIAQTHSNDEIRAEAVYWLGDSDSGEVVSMLEDIAMNDANQDVQEKAVYALAELDDDRGLESLIRIARTHSNQETRKQAVYWLGDSDAEQVPTILEQFAFEDENADVQEQAVYALAELDDDRGLDALIRVARTHPDRETRRQAIHWLGETGDERALDALLEIIESNEE